MNIEQVEHQLTQLKGKSVFLIIPQGGRSSLSLCGQLQVVETKEHTVGFHVTGLQFAFIFFAEDVVSLEPSNHEEFAKTIRICK